MVRSFLHYVLCLISSHALFAYLPNTTNRNRYDQPTAVSDMRTTCNYIFTALFFIEMVLKMIGLGIYQYFADGWNDFDFSCVVVSIVDLALSMSSQGEGIFNTSILRVIRVARVTRLLRWVLLCSARRFPSSVSLTTMYAIDSWTAMTPNRLVRSLSGIRMLMSTLVASIPALGNIGLLLMLIFFIYAVVGMQSFGKFTKYDGLNEYVVILCLKEGRKEC